MSKDVIAYLNMCQKAVYVRYFGKEFSFTELQRWDSCWEFMNKADQCQANFICGPWFRGFLNKKLE